MCNYNDSNLLRLLKVLEGSIPDRIPYMDFSYSKQIVEKILCREIKQNYKKIILEKGTLDDYYELEKKDIIDFCYAIGQDVINYSVWSPENFYLETGEILDRGINKINDFKLFKKISFPDPSEFDEKYKTDFLDIVEYSSKYNMGVILLTGPFFQDTHGLMGWENFMYNIIDDLDFVKEVLYRFSEYYYEIVKYFCKFDIPVLFFTDNIACNNGSFISPKLFKDIYIPLLKKVISPAKEKQIPMIFDSDGDIEWMIYEIIDIGFNAIHPIDPGGMDIYKIKEKYGSRITIMGNVGQDYPLSTGTVNEVKEDVKRRLEILGRGGRYVIKSSHDVGENVKPENFIAMIKTIHEFGYYK